MKTRQLPDAPNSLPDVKAAGISVWDPVWSVNDHPATRNELVHVIEGEVTLHLDGRTFRAGPADSLLIPKGALHRDAFPAGSTFKVLHVVFEWGAFAPLFSPELNQRLAGISPTRKQSIRDKLMGLFSVFRENGPYAPRRVNALLYDLLLFMAGMLNESRRPPGPAAGREARQRELIAAAKQYVRDNYAAPIALKQIADHLQLSEYHLSHLFSREAGFTLSAFITHTRMERAAALLADPRIRVADVAYQVGYDNPNYFGKVFRKHHGCTPGAFRAALNSKNRKK